MSFLFFGIKMTPFSAAMLLFVIFFSGFNSDFQCFAIVGATLRWCLFFCLILNKTFFKLNAEQYLIALSIKLFVF